jgi:hypothetical protein
MRSPSFKTKTMRLRYKQLDKGRVWPLRKKDKSRNCKVFKSERNNFEDFWKRLTKNIYLLQINSTMLRK